MFSSMTYHIVTAFGSSIIIIVTSYIHTVHTCTCTCKYSNIKVGKFGLPQPLVCIEMDFKCPGVTKSSTLLVS